MQSAAARNEIERIQQNITGKLKRHFGRNLEEATSSMRYKALAMCVRDEIMDAWSETHEAKAGEGVKNLYYLSMEFLIGRFLVSNLVSMGKLAEYEAACDELGMPFAGLVEMEPDAGLGNGGLGRLAACFLDSLSTLGLPAYGCGIRYEYGLFKQRIVDGHQVEIPDNWMQDGFMWEIARPEEQVEVHFGGKLVEEGDGDEKTYHVENPHTVIALPYDVPIVGYDSQVVNSLRLWRAKSPVYLDMSAFSQGDYVRATEEKELAEVISKVLYPEDSHHEGKMLRLRQQYFFTSATIQWMLARFKRRKLPISRLPEFAAVQINDTHPAIGIAELMRILMDEEGLAWDNAWAITQQVFSYTNHTIMWEALEKWPIYAVQNLLPRIAVIIAQINEWFGKELWKTYPEQWSLISDCSVIAYEQVHMAHLCIAGSHKVNGVSRLHSDILKNDVFKHFYKAIPEKFTNVTNGITPRRWLQVANPKLTSLIKEAIGDGFLKDLSGLKKLEAYAQDTAFAQKFQEVKSANKVALANYIQDVHQVTIDPASIFDVQVKRLHEYKRQLLNALHILYLYQELLHNPGQAFTPRTFIFGAKASPGYDRAKMIIHFLCKLGECINNEPRVKDLIKVVFVENYGVSLAEKIIPAADVSEQISTAGKEASGTGNMKFMLNGALTVGTMDGANVEMAELAGMENMYIFGMRAEEVNSHLQHNTYKARDIYSTTPRIKMIVDALVDGTVLCDSPNGYTELHNSLIIGDNGNMADPYMVLGDLLSYMQAQERISGDYMNKPLWSAKAIWNVANAGYFSSDRSIQDYNEQIWHLKPLYQ